MSHVSEGELHMILDGAVDLLPADRAEAVERHIGDCRECARRLDEERAIREHAIELMEGTAPIAVVVPAFADIEAMARAAGDREEPVHTVEEDPRTGAAGPRGIWRGLTPGMGLAWAATVVLSLGIGYFGADSLGLAVPQRAAAPAEVERSPAASPRARSPRDVADPSLEEMDEGRPQSPATTPAPAAPLLARNRQLEPLGGAGARSETAFTDNAADAPLQEVLASAQAEAPVQDVLASALDDALAQDVLASALGDAPAQDVLTPAAPRAKAELRLISMAQTTTPSGAPGLELRHLLPSGDTLEIRWVRTEDAEGDLAEAALDEPGVQNMLRGLVSGGRERQQSSVDDARSAPEAGAPVPAVGQAAEAAVREDSATPLPMAQLARPMEDQLDAGLNRATITVGRWRVEAVGPISRDSILTILRALGAPGER